MQLVPASSGGYPNAITKRADRVTADASPNQNPSAAVMSYEVVRRICIEKELFADPSLNEKLFLNYKGFRHIEGLEMYSNVKALYLDNNGIKEIQGLDRMTKLVSLWLQDNALTQIMNLDRNLGLRQLNLSGNNIKRIENLKHLVQLNQLNLAKNDIECIEDIQEVKELPELRNFDISYNSIDATEGVIEFFASLPALVVLRLNGNPGIQNTTHYRKRAVNAMPKLNYLDDRPVFEVEKRSCAAWAGGGNEAMHEAKRDFIKTRENECRVDQDRKQLLTDRRNQMIARLDREQREKEEQAAKLLESSTNQSSEADGLRAVQTGDAQAVDDYEKGWEKKLSLYGREGLQVQEEQRQHNQGRGSAAAAMNAIRKAQEDASREKRTHAEEMKPHPEAYMEQPIRHDASQESTMQAPGRAKSRTANVSDFMVSDAGSALDDSRKPQEVDVLERLSNREQAVWSNAWNMGKTQSEATGAAGAPGADGGNADSEVIPEIWQRNNAQSRGEENDIMDRNMRSTMAAREAEKASKVEKPVHSETELNELD